jgi:hypothetical protein
VGEYVQRKLFSLLETPRGFAQHQQLLDAVYPGGLVLRRHAILHLDLGEAPLREGLVVEAVHRLGLHRLTGLPRQSRTTTFVDLRVNFRLGYGRRD